MKPQAGDVVILAVSTEPFTNKLIVKVAAIRELIDVIVFVNVLESSVEDINSYSKRVKCFDATFGFVNPGATVTVELSGVSTLDTKAVVV